MKNKFKRLLAVLLSLICILSTTPITSYAYDKWDKWKSINTFEASYIIDGSTYSKYPLTDGFENGKGNLPYVYSDSSMPATPTNINYFTFEVRTTVDTELFEGDTYEFEVTLYPNSRYKSFGAVYFASAHATFTYDQPTGVIKGSCVVLKDYKANDKLWITLSHPVPNSTYEKSYLEIRGIRFRSIQSDKAAQQGFFDNVAKWFNNLFQWLKDIRDNLSNGFSNIGSWLTSLGDRISIFFTTLSNNIKGFFSDLSNNIKTWFTNLTNSLKNWFSDVGKWFSEIGDRIGDFFSNLWNNITVKINGITDSISNWWQSVIDFFHSLFVPEEGFFDEYRTKWDDWLAAHFGFMYESVQFIIDFISDLKRLGSGLSKPYITIPQLKLPWNNMVILQSQRWNLDDLTQSHTQLIWVFDTIKLFTSALMFYALLLYGKKTFSELLGMEGEE